ncbi:MAG: cadherin-like domain-containing protein, partial [Salinibacter sp.]
DPTPTTLTLDKSAPSSGGPPVVTFSGSTVNLASGPGTALFLNGGLLKPTGSTDDLADNLVDLDTTDFSRDLSGPNTASASHVVGGVTRTVKANPNNAKQPIYPVGSENPAVYRRYRFTFPAGEVGNSINITVNHITEKLANTDPLPITDNTGVTIGTDFPAYYWQVTADRDLPLNSNYEVSAQVTKQSLTFNSERPSSDYRLLRRNRSDQPQNTTWKLVGNGSGYANEGPVNGVVDIRSQSATADVTNLGRVFTVGVPTGPGPAITTNEGLTLTEGNKLALTDSLVAQDEDNSASELTYTVTTAPTNGDLQDGSGNVIGKGGTFTQADINNGNVSYAASSAGSDSFKFEVSDPEGNTATGTFSITVNVGTVSISGTVTYPTEGDGSLGSGSGIGGVTVEASAGG